MGQKPETQKREVALKELQRGVGAHADTAHHSGVIVVITRHKKEYAALIGLADLERLRKLKKKTA
jgi:PHD/YefM family antitoxin component YafN of YafNO toxin-antitoxin module